MGFYKYGGGSWKDGQMNSGRVPKVLSSPIWDTVVYFCIATALFALVFLSSVFFD